MYIRTRLLDRRLRIHNPNKYFNYKIRNFKVMVINHTVKLNKLCKYITENLWTYVQSYDILLLHGKFSNPNQNAHNLSIP